MEQLKERIDLEKEGLHFYLYFPSQGKPDGFFLQVKEKEASGWGFIGEEVEILAEVIALLIKERNEDPQDFMRRLQQEVEETLHSG